MFTDNKSANSTNWPSIIFLTSFPGTGAWPGPTAKDLSDLCCEVEGPRDGRLHGRVAEENVEETGATRRVELEPVMADTGVKVEINGGKVNVPGEDAIPAPETCELATDEETTEDG